MTDFCFSKIRENLLRPLLVMFEMGEFRKPIAILDVVDLIAAVREYGQAAFLRELKKFDVEAKEAAR
jgi:hypothetical protein